MAWATDRMCGMTAKRRSDKGTPKAYVNSNSMRRGKNVSRLYLIVLSLVVFGATGGIAAAATGQFPGTSPYATQRAKVPAGYSGINDPRLLACMQRKLVCNRVAAGELRQSFSRPTVAGATLISRGRAEGEARSMVGASATAPTHSALMTGAQFLAAFRQQRSANIDESRPVWIVTVNAPIPARMSDGLQAATSEASYSAVIDAATGILTDDCLGCSWMTVSR